MVKLFFLDIVILVLEIIMASSISYSTITEFHNVHPLIIFVSVVSIVVWAALFFTTLVSMHKHLGD